LIAGTDPLTRPDAPLPAHSAAPSPAVAPPPGNPRFPLFDSLRGVAVLAVLIYHVTILTGAMPRRAFGDVVAVAGGQAPMLFFAISGFLLYRPWVAARHAGRRGPGTGRFLRRRALRILPAYWVVLTLLAIYPGITGVFTDDWWRYYFFLQLYDARTFGQGLPVAWTLCVEVTFYLALPLWALAMQHVRLGSGPRAWARGQLAALALLAAGGAAVQVAAGREAIGDLASHSALGQSTWFALGMAMAVISVTGGTRRGRDVLRAVAARPGACWAVAAAAFAALVVLRHEPGGLLGIILALETQQPYPKLLADLALSSIMLVLILAPVIWDTPARVPQRVLSLAPLAWLGVVSYSVYLWHLTIAELLVLRSIPQHFEAHGLALAERMPNGVTPVAIVLTLAASCAVAAVSYRYVELPFLRRKER
jgi:peptidoglycan/LPS O-acetylase OafA/YrhL